MLRRLRLIVVLAFLMLLVIPTAGVLADNIYSNPQGPPLHWRDGERDRGYAYWIDNTGSEWPVLTAAIDWDQKPQFNGVYVSSGSACPSNCIRVGEVDFPNQGCDTPFGETRRVWYADSGHFVGGDDGVRVRVDSQCDSRDYDTRRELVCHEMGHSIGIRHVDHSADTCMREGVLDEPEHVSPRPHDYDMIAQICDHND